MTPAPDRSKDVRKRPELWLPAAAFVAIFATSLAANPSAAGLFAAFVVWLATASVLFGGWNAIRRMRGKTVRGIPATEQWVAAHVQWKVFLVLGLVFFSVREGALAPDFVLNFNNYTLDQHLNKDTSSSVNGSRIGDAPEIRLSERSLRLSFPLCHGDEVLCRGFQAALPAVERYNDDPASIVDPPSIAPVSLNVTAHSNATCMMPLTKSGTFRIEAMADIHVTNTSGKVRIEDLENGDDLLPIAIKSLSVNISMNLRQEMLGPASCRVFKLAAGAHLAKSLMNSLEQTVAQH